MNTFLNPFKDHIFWGLTAPLKSMCSPFGSLKGVLFMGLSHVFLEVLDSRGPLPVIHGYIMLYMVAIVVTIG